MLPIMEKMQRLSTEADEYIKYLGKVENALKKCEGKNASLEELKPYLIYERFGKNSIIRDDATFISDIIRKAHRRDISVKEARKKVEKAIAEMVIVKSGTIKIDHEKGICSI